MGCTQPHVCLCMHINTSLGGMLVLVTPCLCRGQPPFREAGVVCAEDAQWSLRLSVSETRMITPSLPGPPGLAHIISPSAPKPSSPCLPHGECHPAGPRTRAHRSPPVPSTAFAIWSGSPAGAGARRQTGNTHTHNEVPHWAAIGN